MKNVFFLMSVVVLSPIALVGFIYGIVRGALRVGVRGAESFFTWTCS